MAATPAPDADAERAGLTLAFHHRVCLAWLTAHAAHLLQAGPLRLPWRPTCMSHYYPMVPDANIVVRCTRQPATRSSIPWGNMFMLVARDHVSTNMTACPTRGSTSCARQAGMSLRNKSSRPLLDLIVLIWWPTPPTGTACALDLHITALLVLTDPCGPQLHRATLAKAGPDGPLVACALCRPPTLPLSHSYTCRLCGCCIESYDAVACALSLDAVTWGIRFARVTPDEIAGLAHAHALGSYSVPNMTGRPGYRTMEMNGGSSAPYLARTPCVPSFSTLFNRGGNGRVFRLPGAGGGSFPLYGGTFAQSYSVSTYRQFLACAGPTAC